MGLSRDGQPQPAQGRNGWGTAGLEVTLGVGAISLCFYFILALSWLQTHYSSHLPIHPASSGPKGQRTKSEQWFYPCRHHLQVHVSFHQVIREGEEGVRIGH